MTPRTRALIVNSPHNPTGMVLSDAELAAIAEIAVARRPAGDHRRGLRASGVRRPPPPAAGRLRRAWPSARSPSPARPRCSTAPAGRSDGLAAPADLIAGVRAAKQYLSYVGGAPFQPAVAQALDTEDAWVAALRDVVAGQARPAGRRRSTDIGFEVHDSFGTYFLCADPRPLGYDDSTAFCAELPEKVGVAAIPMSAFCDPGAEHAGDVESPGALRLLQARRHPRRGHPPAGRAASKVEFPEQLFPHFFSRTDFTLGQRARPSRVRAALRSRRRAPSSWPA